MNPPPIDDHEEFRLQTRLLDAVGQSVIATDADGVVIYWNPAAERTYGWTREEALGTSILELNVSTSDRTSAEEILLAVEQEGRWVGEFEARRKDGSTFVVHTTLTALRDADGAPIGHIGVSADMSGLKETESALRERVKELRVLHGATEILNRTGRPLGERLQELVDLLPSGWLDPERTEVRLTLEGRTFETSAFRETPWMQAVEIRSPHDTGRLEIALTGEPGKSEPVFLSEERDLLDHLGRLLGDFAGRESLERLMELTFASMMEAVLVIDGSGGGRGIRYANSAAERMFGYGSEELLGGDTRMLHVDDEAFDRFGEESRVALARHGAFAGNFRLRRRDGSTFPAQQTVTLLDPDLGHAGGAVCVIRDISQQREAEDRLRASRERFGVLSQEIADLIFVVSEDGTIGTASSSVLSMTGYSRAEFERMNAFELVHPEDRGKVGASLEEVRSEEERTVRVEHRIVRKDGEVRYIESVARNLLGNPAVGGILVTARDVSERRELEQRIRQMQKMESVGQLAGGIAHDFNNILTVIRSQTDLILMDLADGPLTEEIRLVQVAADRAAVLTGQLLAFSRDQVLQPRIVDLCESVRESGRLVERIIGENIRIEYRIPDSPCSVWVDPHQLEQVLLNLVLNARDAMQDGGTLTIAVGQEEVDAETAASLELAKGTMSPGTYRVLSVSDTGSGMSEDVRRRVFEPFFTTKPKEKGTGLGLAMVYGTVRQSGGSIHVESTPGEGTTFYLRFPVPDEAMSGEGPRTGEDAALRPGSDQSGSESGERGATGTILVIEDDAAVRRAVCRVLTKSGFTVREAPDAESGLRIIESAGAPPSTGSSEPSGSGGAQDPAGPHDAGAIDAVLTDLVLPGMSGFDLVDRLKESSPDLPLIVMSGYAEGFSGRGDGMPRGVTFVQKPFTPEVLVGMVRAAMLRSSAPAG